MLIPGIPLPEKCQKECGLKVYQIVCIFDKVDAQTKRLAQTGQ